MPPHRPHRRSGDQDVCSCIPNVTIRSKIWFEIDGQFAIGEGGAGLLKAVRDLGSLARAAREVGWSYRHAWGYVRHAEEVLAVRLLETRSGKGTARGTVLTPAARALLVMFEQAAPANAGLVGM